MTTTMSRPVKLVRTLHERLKIIEEVEKNSSEKRIDIAKRLGLAPSTLNSIVAKKKEIREQINKCGYASTKRKTGRESTFMELESVLFTWYQQAQASNVLVDGKLLREKAKKIATKLNVQHFAASNGWITRFKERHGLVYKKLAREKAVVSTETADVYAEEYLEVCVDRAEKEEEDHEEVQEKNQCESDAVPSFAEAHAALMKLKSFFYAHNISEREEDNILKMEDTLFDLKNQISEKHLSNTELFGKSK